MSKVQGRLRIAVQKSGRLAERSLDLIRNAGLRVIKGNNDLLYKVENAPVDLLRVRDDDSPTFVADGVGDLGIVGENVLEEARNGAPSHVSETLTGSVPLTDAEIAERMSGNLCRCSAYPFIREAIAMSAEKKS